MYPDGKVRIWNINNTIGTTPPTHIIPLNTSVTSLLWSPHCKELLSTHGMSWLPRGGASESCPNLLAASSSESSLVPGTGRRRNRERERPVSVKTPLTNSLTVHAYPSLRRVVSVLRDARHGGTVIFVPPDDTGEPDREHPYIDLRYPFADDRARLSFPNLIVDILNRLARLQGTADLGEEPKAVGWEQFERTNDEEITTLDEALFETAHLIAGLAAADGAVVSLRDSTDEAYRAAEELGINISSRFESSSIDEI